MIAVGCDHGGYKLKLAVMSELTRRGIEYRDFGSYSEESVDYPAVAAPLARAVAAGECEKGLLFCGTGIGMSIAANKVDGIRAAACSDKYSAEFTRRHNDANVLCLGGRVIDEATAIELCDIFLSTPYEGGRHARRVEMLSQIEKGEL